jgi:carboxyl-terminal processing protease
MLPVLLVAGMWLGGHPRDLPGFLADAFVADHNTQVVNQAIDRVVHDYYRPVKSSELADASIAGVVASLHDRFSNYLTPSEYRDFDSAGSFSGVGIDVQPEHRGLLIQQVFDQSPAQRAGLMVGDLITSANGHSLVGLSPAASTALITGRPGTDVTLGYERHGAAHTVTVTRATISEPVVASQVRNVGGHRLAVVALSMFSSGAHTDVRQAVDKALHAGARGIVLDLRHNGGGLVEEARLVASIFIPQGVIVTTRGRTQPTMTLTAAGGAIPTSIPVVVLVDRGTASASEIVTGALQDHRRAIVVGTHTFGKGVFQEVTPLSNGGALDITVGEYFTPDGHNLGGSGVNPGAGLAPDVPVPASRVDNALGLQVALRTLAAQVK